MAIITCQFILLLVIKVDLSGAEPRLHTARLHAMHSAIPRLQGATAPCIAVLLISSSRSIAFDALPRLCLTTADSVCHLSQIAHTQFMESDQ